MDFFNTLFSKSAFFLDFNTFLTFKAVTFLFLHTFLTILCYCVRTQAQFHHILNKSEIMLSDIRIPLLLRWILPFSSTKLPQLMCLDAFCVRYRK